MRGILGERERPNMAETRLASSLSEDDTLVAKRALASTHGHASSKACSCLYTGLALKQWAIINTSPGLSRVYSTVSPTSLFHE